MATGPALLLSAKLRQGREPEVALLWRHQNPPLGRYGAHGRRWRYESAMSGRRVPPLLPGPPASLAGRRSEVLLPDPLSAGRSRGAAFWKAVRLRPASYAPWGIFVRGHKVLSCFLCF